MTPVISEVMINPLTAKPRRTNHTAPVYSSSNTASVIHEDVQDKENVATTEPPEAKGATNNCPSSVSVSYCLSLDCSLHNERRYRERERERESVCV